VVSLHRSLCCRPNNPVVAQRSSRLLFAWFSRGGNVKPAHGRRQPRTRYKARLKTVRSAVSSGEITRQGFARSCRPGDYQQAGNGAGNKGVGSRFWPPTGIASEKAVDAKELRRAALLTVAGISSRIGAAW